MYLKALKNHNMVSLILENNNVVILETSIEEKQEPKNSFKVRHWTSKDRATIKRLRERGWSETSIGEFFNKSRSAIYYAMKQGKQE